MSASLGKCCLRVFSVTHHSDGQGPETEHGTGNGGAHSGWGGPWHVVYQLGLGSWDVGPRRAAGWPGLRSAE
jgi:hypothetical protein